MRRSLLLLLSSALASAACGAAPLRLQRVVLHPSGIAYFERSGRVGAEGLRLRVMPHEVDDVLTTLTLVDRGGTRSVPSVVVPRTVGEGPQEITVELGEARELTIAYAAPASAWRASYRVVLPDERRGEQVLLQAWAVVDNTGAEDWRDVELSLATDAPLSFAVDLRTPRLVSRPVVDGHSAPPIALGPVGSERSTRFDDGDAIPLERDQCPDEPEDVDGDRDDDGCPDVDRDGDGIQDVDDRCPDEGETQNGIEDVDGCPDRGLVRIESNEIRIAERVYFEAGSSELTGTSGPVLDAIAATLRAHAALASLRVQGYAHSSEPDPWRLSAERAALSERGVGGSRLIAEALGDSRPLGGGPEADRRVDFQIERAPAPSTGSTGGVRAPALARTLAAAPLPRSTGAGTRFVVGRRVSVPAGGSAMVAILSQHVDGQDVLLFRPDPNVPASRSRPLRAARLVNETALDLAPGPVTIFRDGELVGQGLLATLYAGEHAFVPYAVDESSSVRVETQQEELPHRVLALRAGLVTLERFQQRRTRYRAELGERVPAQLYVRHGREGGFEPRDLPPGSEASPDALLVPIPIDPRTDASVEVLERRAVPLQVQLLEDLHVDLRPYALPEGLTTEQRARFERLLEERERAARARTEAERLRTRLSEAGALTAELRRDVRALEPSSPVRRRLAQRLDEAVRHAEALSQELADLRAAQSTALARLREAAGELELGP